MPEDWANPVPRGSLADHAFEAVRNALMRGQIPPGARLSLRPLSKRFGISATPMREALLRLESTGAVELNARGTAVVPHLTRAQLDEIRAIRLDLEGRTAIAAVERATGDGIAGLEQIQAGIVDAQQRGAYAEAIDLNTRFHIALCRLGGMPIMLDIVENLWVRCGPILSHLYDDGIPQWDPHPHSMVIDGLHARDAAAVRRAIEFDILNGGSGLLRHARGGA